MWSVELRLAAFHCRLHITSGPMRQMLDFIVRRRVVAAYQRKWSSIPSSPIHHMVEAQQLVKVLMSWFRQVLSLFIARRSCSCSRGRDAGANRADVQVNPSHLHCVHFHFQSLQSHHPCRKGISV